MWHHPKYYKELRKRNKLAESRQPVVGGQQQSDQVISKQQATASSTRAPDPGLKPQASSSKLQASSPKLLKIQAASVKPQATSLKLQAASDKPLDSSTLIKFHVSRDEVLCQDKTILWMPYMEGNLVW